MENNKTTEELINSTMKDVIDVTKKAREVLFKDGKIVTTNRDKINVVKTVIESNKNLVSASQTMIKVKQM